MACEKFSSCETGAAAAQPTRRRAEITTGPGPSDARLKRHAVTPWSGSRLLTVCVCVFHLVYQFVFPFFFTQYREFSPPDAGPTGAQAREVRRRGGDVSPFSAPVVETGKPSGVALGLSGSRLTRPYTRNHNTLWSACYSKQSSPGRIADNSSHCSQGGSPGPPRGSPDAS